MFPMLYSMTLVFMLLTFFFFNGRDMNIFKC